MEMTTADPRTSPDGVTWTRSVVMAPRRCTIGGTPHKVHHIEWGHHAMRGEMTTRSDLCYACITGFTNDYQLYYAS